MSCIINPRLIAVVLLWWKAFVCISRALTDEPEARLSDRGGNRSVLVPQMRRMIGCFEGNRGNDICFSCALRAAGGATWIATLHFHEVLGRGSVAPPRMRRFDISYRTSVHA
ncbi:hypothetical protein BU23DRAFT_102855 [Bimuria novae-zelandiae CBS 107.79]|uniref:Secreted protein n=1 Tax=Bimuria novae-zelandiae CBS 107.79 TaxID=1447943 RepID=A0A6A5VPU8_9PLEO|nr:hypothetical protein BU23DRAFT_102855 [Bimuria novae-zelandiae CBS 107.79]